MGSHLGELWTREELKAVQDAVLDRRMEETIEETSKMLQQTKLPGRSLSAVMKKVSDYRLSLRSPGTHTRYLKQDIDIFTDAVHSNPSMSISEIADMLQPKFPYRTKKAILDKMLELDLRADCKKKPTVSPSQDKQYPLVKLLYLLDDARHNDDAWNNIFSRSVTVVQSIYEDVNKCKMKLAKMDTIYKQHQVDVVNKMSNQLTEIENEVHLGKLTEN